MQYRGFIHFALLLLASGCFVFSLFTTLVSLLIFSLALELLCWGRIFGAGHEAVDERTGL